MSDETAVGRETDKDKEKIYPSHTELRIYPSFTEIREKFNAPKNFKMYFPREVYDQIVRGSLSIEGIPVLNQNAITKANNLENQIVFVRRHREEAIQCQVIRANDLLLKDLKTGRFFHGQHNELEYTQVPEEQGTEVTFSLKEPGESTLSYLVQGIVWSPRYNLKIEDQNRHQFEAWADITNDTKRDYKIKRTELFGGDVRLEQVNSYETRPRIMYQQCCMRACAYDSGGEPPLIESEGELAGVYWYSIDQPFGLIQQSTYSIPFVKANLTLQKYAGLENHFQSANQKGKFQRKYQIESDRFLPKGLITIREDGRIVGQAQLRNISQGEKQTLDCGDDPDVNYSREVHITSQKRNSADHQIRLTIQNKKSKSIQCRYKELINSVKFDVIPKGDNEDHKQLIQIHHQGLEIGPMDLQPNSEYSFEYDVHLEYRNPTDEPC